MSAIGAKQAGSTPTAAWLRVEDKLLSGRSLLINGVPGSGKTTLAKDLAVNALKDHSAEPWAPVLVLTPDRHRAAEVELEISRALPSGGAAVFRSPGSHRLIRSLSSYAHLVTDLWRVERDVPLGRIPFTSGAREDAWLAKYLERNAQLWEAHYGEAVIASPAFRMEVRNVISRSGEVGLEAADLEWLGIELDRPLWRLSAHAYAEYAGLGTVPFTLETPHIDSARIPRIAARLVERWKEDAPGHGVTAPVPVPRLLIVDDVQDMPASATALISAVARLADQTVLLSSPDSATAEFRGGRPDLGNEISQILGLETERLDVNLRANAQVAAVGYEVADWISPRTDGLAENREPSGSSVTVDLAATETKRDTLIAQRLRQHHLENGIPWEDMAVVMRGAAEIEPLRRRLARLEVPLQSANRPIQLAKSPTCAALLRLLELGGELGGYASSVEDRDSGLAENQVDVERLQQAAVDLVSSPLVNADPLAVFRLIRNLRSLDGDGLHSGAGTLELLEVPDAVIRELEDEQDRAKSRALTAIRRARKLWRLKEEAAAKNAEVGLWKLWEASELAEPLRAKATNPDPAKAVVREIAADTLDSVIALFRKADLWQQEQLEVSPEHEFAATAYHFAAETLEQTVATDPLVKGGLAQPGVAVVTASQAAGASWPVVCLVGPQLGSWPTSGSDSLAQLGRLRLVVDDATARGWPGEVPIAPYVPDLDVGLATNYRQSRIERSRNDARLFLSAVTRAESALHFFAVESEDQAPSPFILTLAEAGILPPLHDDEGQPIYTEAAADLDIGSLVANLRKTLVSASASDRQRAEASRLLALLSVQGVATANPRSWMGVGSTSTDTPILEIGRIPLSPSRLDTAADCQLKWFFTVVQGEDRETGEQPEVFTRAALGTLIHGLAEDFPEGPSQELRRAFEERWPSLGLTDDTHWGRHWKNQATKMVDRLAAYIANSDGKVETELWMKLEVGDGTVHGRIDRLEYLPDGSARVVDIKTGAAITQNQVANNPQLLAYQVGVSEMGLQPAGARLLQVAEERENKIVVTQEALDDSGINEHREHLTDVASTLSGATFLAQPDAFRCRYCPFAKSCPALQGKKGDADA